VSQFDLIILGGTVVTHEGETRSDIGVVDGQVVAIEPNLNSSAHETVDAKGLHIFPGLIDSHVHFNDPGRDDWEGIETGSRALVAGGGAMFFDMPLNSSPPTLDATSFDSKLAVAREKSLTNFALWGGLVPWNLDHLEALAERGVIGFKAFMSNSGMGDFGCVDHATLREGMRRAAKLGKLVAVHAESELITSELTNRAVRKGKTGIRDYLDSRPIPAELEAIHHALEIAGETGCALHIVHVSSGAGVALVASAQKQGVDVTCETCPHYLVLTEQDVEKLGAVAKCAPPLRTKSAQDVLWRYVEGGHVATIGSDHSPSPPEMKRSANFFKVWGGISGVQHTLPLLISECGARSTETETTLSLISRMTSFNVAERFKLPQTKGRIAVGADADLALVDLKQQFTVRAEDLLYRHRQSPYVGRALTGRVVRTILRGITIFNEGRVTMSSPLGRLVKPIGS